MELINSTRHGRRLHDGHGAQRPRAAGGRRQRHVSHTRRAGRDAALHEEQVPLVMSDVFFGEPGLSAPKYEVDFAPRKHALRRAAERHRLCGSRPTRRARHGRYADRRVVQVVRRRRRSILVQRGRQRVATGRRAVHRNADHYDRAFGGADLRMRTRQSTRHSCRTPAAAASTSTWIDRVAARVDRCRIRKSANDPVTTRDGYLSADVFRADRPALGARATICGHLRSAVARRVFPFLPADFDEQYYQAAPLDQQLPKPVG